MKKSHKILLIILIVFAALAITGKIVISNIEKNLKGLTELEIEQVDLTQVNDGIYFGSHDAFPISVEVEVEVSNHKIDKIEILKHDNGQGKDAESIVEDIVNSQSLDVDAISGATYSRIVIRKAVEDALLD
ncbi:FMN-binding protein [Alkalibacter saccharofermentans]|uniref:FMN-binding domain-containing protein n=1 Tax=Alkalibacter saccharofermentans DSM 14828 TaxID=1120975 RepID=A0A1M4WXV7_9FIRM|nr:FMN-binding protein [Alkalibacter saccharofermentans]SHE86084.1 FMN-binding domain-containing protein [Alkalibacter saccharofermentans DSM 14828]